MNRAILILLFFLLNTSAVACSCIGKSSVVDAIKASDVVLSGKVLSKKIVQISDDKLTGGFVIQRAVFEFEILHLYKGELLKRVIEITTGIGHGDCGFGFVVGQSYIVYSVYKTRYSQYGEGVEPFLYTDICTRTMPQTRVEQRRLRRKASKVK